MKIIRAMTVGCALLSAVFAAQDFCLGVAYEWDGGGSNDRFGTASNWNPSGIPGSADAVSLRNRTLPYAVDFFNVIAQPIPLPDITLPINPTVDRLIVGSNSVTFDDAPVSSTLTLDNSSTAEAHPVAGTPVRGITIGAEANDTAAVLISHLSILEAVAATLGHAAGSSGTLTLNQNNDRFNVTGAAENALIVGLNGSGVINVSSGADVFVATDTTLARNTSGNGTINVTGGGSSLTSDFTLQVGGAGTGTLNISASGTVTNGNGIVAGDAGSSGSVTVTGNGSWTNNELLIVGGGGDGELEITGGGQVISLRGYIGFGATATGLVTIRDNSSKWRLGEDLSIGQSGSTATLNVLNGGLLELGPSLSVFVRDSGTINLDGAEIRSHVNNSGEINVTGPAVITRSLTNTIGASTRIDPAEPVGAMGLDVIGSVTNEGAVDIHIDYAEPVVLVAALHVGAGLNNSGEFDVMIDYAEPVSVSAIDVNGHFTNSGDANIMIHFAEPVSATALDVSQNIVNNGTFRMTIDRPGSVGTGHAIVAGSITNGGMLTLQNAAEADMIVQLGVGQAFTNNAMGVVNFDGPADENGDNIISGIHIINGNLVNNGEFNIHSNTHIVGSLTTGIDADMIIESGQPCCGIVVEVSGPVSNNGTIELRELTTEATSQLFVPQGIAIGPAGVVKGTGTIEGSVVNRGQVEPGNSSGVLTVTGYYTQESEGRLVVEVAGTSPGSEYDQLTVSGEISLDGFVQVVFAEDFTPQVGNRFQIITTAAAVTGKFAVASLPGLPVGMDWGITYATNEVVVAIGIPGDYNANGTVDAADYTVWRDSVGRSGAFLAADGDVDNDVDADDYQFWKDHFGDAAGSASAETSHFQNAVPEPGGMFLAATVMMLCSLRRTQR